jgi:hypothetical protein
MLLINWLSIYLKKEKRRIKMARKSYPSNAWEYTDWLYCSGRLTADEHLKLKEYLLKLEKEAASESYIPDQGC